jgi:predicted DNA-binding transcriptional regulator AlpA
MKRCISYKELRLIVPYSRTHLPRIEALPPESDPFPKRVRLSKCRICWWLHEVLEWLERRSVQR